MPVFRMAHIESGIRTHSGTAPQFASTGSAGVLHMPLDGPSTVICASSGAEVAAPGWDAFDALARQCAREVDLRTRRAFSEAVDKWAHADRSVFCEFTDEAASIHGLSYQTSALDILAAVWEGFSHRLAEVLSDHGPARGVRIRSEHPGVDSLVEALRARGMDVGVETDAIDRAGQRFTAASSAVAERAAS